MNLIAASSPPPPRPPAAHRGRVAAGAEAELSGGVAAPRVGGAARAHGEGVVVGDAHHSHLPRPRGPPEQTVVIGVDKI